MRKPTKFFNRPLGTLPVLVAAAALSVAGAGACGGGIDEASSAVDVPDGHVRTTFVVEGMTCGGCTAAARTALKRIEGVSDADASVGEGDGPGSAWAVYDPARVSPDELMEAIRKVGFTATPAGD